MLAQSTPILVNKVTFQPLWITVSVFTLGEPDQIGADMWDYQACTEMIMPMCFDGVADMFEKAEWNETEVIETCQAKWKVKPRIKMADIMYGSKELHGSSNIIFRYDF